MNKVFKHSANEQMQVEVILASKSSNGAPPIYTVRMRYPRPIHGEIMTHRDFSRNARSSRAVPVKTMLDEVRNIPYTPWHWGANQKGMQATEECNETVVIAPAVNNCTREEAWLFARDWAALVAEGFMNAGYHKQNPNRLLEPFSWMDTLITSTKWANFLWLRDHEAAEPHLRDLAVLVDQALKEAEIRTLGEHGGWHLPYIRENDFDWAYKFVAERDGVTVPDRQERAKLLAKISAARCARISYKPFDGDASYEREIERYNGLVKSDRVHASPLEHQAQADRFDPDEPNTGKWEYPMLSGNLDPGWIQFRKTVPNEAYHV